MRQKSPIISLTGGLGNQLFQLAAALSFFGGSKIKLEWGIGKPRLNALGLPELTSFVLPENVELLTYRKFSWLMSKSTGYILRMGTNPRWYEKNRFIQAFIKSLGELIGLFYFNEHRRVFSSDNIGYTALTPDNEASFVIGYFQSHVYASQSNVREKLLQICSLDSASIVSEFAALAEKESPLVIHIRLGDYKNEAHFGLLDENYFNTHLLNEWSTGRYKKVWLFSDEPNLALNYISSVEQEFIRVFDSPEFSTSTTFDLMRLGNGYIISNSTFSWWAAFLARNQSAKVIAPNPWFRNLADPDLIIPPAWTRVFASWKETDVNVLA
jgi:hypothetical protein